MLSPEESYAKGIELVMSFVYCTKFVIWIGRWLAKSKIGRRNELMET